MPNATLLSSIARLPDRGAAQIVVGLIHLYRRFLSPHKGFKCPHHMVHGQGSCSDFGLEALRGEGLIRGMKAIKQRFVDCKCAAVSITSTQNQSPKNDTKDTEKSAKKKKAKDGGWGAACADFGLGGLASLSVCGFSQAGKEPTPETPEPLPSAPGETPGDLPSTESCSSIDVPAPDCGGVDCAPSCSW